MEGLQLIATGGALPGRLVTNDDLSRLVDTSDEWITTRTGIRQRRFCGEGEDAGSMAIEAARQALANSGLDPAQIGCCLCATIAARYLTPTNACLIQQELGLPQDIPVLDINAACSGFIYGAAVARGLTVLYCIGEKSEEQDAWQQVLGDQLSIGLEGVDKSKVTIAYEPIWSIGPGKTPADKPYITKIARFVKEQTGGMDVVYGGGLKTDNAAMLASIPEIDGGLIALTRFAGEIGFYPEEYLDIIRLYMGR